MSVGKITFKGPDSISNKAEVKKEEPKTSVLAEENKEKSNAAKYMIGATALAATIAVGIIGHKNNWWRKAADAADDLSKKGSETLDNAKNKVSIENKVNKDALTEPNITSEVTDVDFSDFTKIQGKSYELGCMKYIDIFNEDGKLIRSFSSKNGKTLYSIKDYNPSTGKRTKETYFQEDGKTLKSIDDCDPSTGKRTKITYFQEDGKNLELIKDYDPSTRHFIKETCFQPGGKTLKYVADYKPTTGKQIKMTYFQKDGKTPDFVIDYDPSTDKKLKTTYYKPDGTIDRVENAS